MPLTEVRVLRTRRLVTPWEAPGPSGRRIEPRRELPLLLDRQPFPGPLRERLGLVEADVHHRLVQRQPLPMTEPQPPPLAVGELPEPRRDQRGLPHVRPPGLGPPPRIV